MDDIGTALGRGVLVCVFRGLVHAQLQKSSHRIASTPHIVFGSFSLVPLCVQSAVIPN